LFEPQKRVYGSDLDYSQQSKTIISFRRIEPASVVAQLKAKES
jgi:hypothetical protein